MYSAVRPFWPPSSVSTLAFASVSRTSMAWSSSSDGSTSNSGVPANDRCGGDKRLCFGHIVPRIPHPPFLQSKHEQKKRPHPIREYCAGPLHWQAMHGPRRTTYEGDCGGMAVPAAASALCQCCPAVLASVGAIAMGKVVSSAPLVVLAPSNAACCAWAAANARAREAPPIAPPPP